MRKISLAFSSQDANRYAMHPILPVKIFLFLPKTEYSIRRLYPRGGKDTRHFMAIARRCDGFYVFLRQSRKKFRGRKTITKVFASAHGVREKVHYLRQTNCSTLEPFEQNMEGENEKSMPCLSESSRPC